MAERLSEEQLRNLADQVKAERDDIQARLVGAERLGIGGEDHIREAESQRTALTHLERGIRVAIGEELPYTDSFGRGTISFSIKG